MFLLVKRSGARSWSQRMRIHGRYRELGLGPFPAAPFAEVREKALENWRAMRAGRDPLAERQRAKSMPTFEEATCKALAEKAQSWKNPADRRKALNAFERHVFPATGSLPLDAVTSADLRRVLRRMEERVPDLARKAAAGCPTSSSGASPRG